MVKQDDVAMFEELRHQIGWQDARDPRFAALSGTVEADYKSFYEPLKVQIYEDHRDVPTGRELIVYATFPPSSIIDSSDLTTTLYAAQVGGASPVFVRPVHHAELAYRYEQYRAGLAVLNENAGSHFSTDEFNIQLGTVAFHLGNAVLSSSRVGQLRVEEIVELRTSMEAERRRFVSEHLVAATNLIEGNPWDESVKTELQRYVQGPIAGDLMRFQEESKSRFERLVGNFGGHLIDLSRGSLIGSGLGLVGTVSGVTANVVPGASPLLLILVAALGGALQQSPKLAKDIIDWVLENRTAGRSSMAYLASLAYDSRR
jgi:hypothetical protein